MPNESNFIHGKDPRAGIAQLAAFTFDQLEHPPGEHQVNLRRILDLCWGADAVGLHEQLKRTWITESVLCSAPTATGDHDGQVRHMCRERYLDKQIALLKDRPCWRWAARRRAVPG